VAPEPKELSTPGVDCRCKKGIMSVWFCFLPPRCTTLNCLYRQSKCLYKNYITFFVWQVTNKYPVDQKEIMHFDLLLFNSRNAPSVVSSICTILTVLFALSALDLLVIKIFCLIKCFSGLELVWFRCRDNCWLMYENLLELICES